ncbi:MAG: hemolysin family protein [Verrucomicrobia bacterium]|nr:hemolysin family protein [Verrucomicrobiota bacterium]
MSGITLEIIFIFVLLLANGVFAMAEISLVASRKAKLKTLADEGHNGAKLAHNLALAPGKFLSTVQVGITLVGTLAGAFGGAGIANRFESYLVGFGLGAEPSHYISLFIVVAIITYFSVIIGELVPKRLALSNPEKIASALARPMNALATSFSPIVNLLSHSSDFLMALLGVRKTKESAVSEEEVRVLIDEGLSTGVFKKAEKDMVEGVFELDEQHAGDLMTPRARMIWLSLDDTDDENWRRIAGSGHSHFPVYQETRDNVIGMVSVKSLWANLSLAGRVELRALVTPPLYVPTAMPAGRLIESFKKSGKHIALVVDEFGGLQGLVTLNDVMMAIVGNLPEREQRHDPKAALRQDGTWLIDAMLDIDETKSSLGIEEDLPGENENRFSTLGGFILFRTGHIPREGEKFMWDGFEFEIIDMDRQRIDKVLVTPRAPKKPESEENSDPASEI